MIQPQDTKSPADGQSSLTVGLAAMKRDAERYRFLRSDERDDGFGVWALKDSNPIEKGWMMTGELDNAIDAAMAANAEIRGG